MKLHEYQAKGLFKKYGIPVPTGMVIHAPHEIDGAVRTMGNQVLVVKAQVHAGGRGKAGGVKVGKTTEEVRSYCNSILGMKLISKQTGPEGTLVRKVLIEEGCAIDRELYVALTIDRATQKVAIMASQAGGMEIEEVAAKSPEKILVEVVDPTVGLMPYKARKLAFALGLKGAQIKQATAMFQNLYKLFCECDCSLAEINPLVVTKEGNLLAIDAKIGLDDNATFRHPDLMELRDIDEEDPREYAASKFNLNFISLDGNIGCMVNGAGLAMATMDIIKYYGGNPANFLDVGGGAKADQVREAFKLLIADKNVRGVLVNIFGGIMKCDVIAQGIIDATRQLALDIPVVVRLEGTNVELGKKMLNESGLAITSANDMADAAQKIVSIVKGRG